MRQLEVIHFDLRGIVYCCILYTAVYLYTCIPVTVDVYQVYSWEDAGRCDGAVYLVYSTKGIQLGIQVVHIRY